MVFEWKTFIIFALSHKGEIAKASLITLIMTALVLPIPLIVPLLIEDFFDSSTNNDSFNSVIIYFEGVGLSNVYQIPLFFIIVFSLRVIFLSFNKLQYSIFVSVSSGIARKIRALMLGRIFSINTSEFKSISGSTMATRILHDVDILCDFICNFLGKCLVSLITIIFSLMIMLHINVALGFSIFLLYPLVIFYWTKVAMSYTDIKNIERNAQENYTKYVTSTLNNIDTVRTVSGTQYFYDKILLATTDIQDKAILSRNDSHIAIQNSSFILNSGIDLFQFATLLIAINANLTVSEILVIFGYLWLVQNPILDIINLKSSYYSATSSLQRINSLLITKIEPSGIIDLLPSKFDINFADVEFSYGNDLLIYKNLNISFLQGDFISVGGVSGSGKSSLVNLLIGFSYPDKGNIRYGGRTIFEIGAQALRKEVVAVLQHSHIFNSSLRENLALGKSISDKKLVSVLTMCQMQDFLYSNDDNLDVTLGDNGIKLSGGQVQRIAIARAVLMNPKVLILDESTSSLDIETEKLLFTELMTFLKDRTTIIISHRLETLRLADKQYIVRDSDLFLKCSDNN